MSRPGTDRNPTSRRTLVATTVALVAGIVIGAAVSFLGAPASASATPSGHGGGAAGGAGSGAFVPACPRPVYSADGNVNPLFCKVDNPVALKFYGRLAPKLFALPSNATTQQVASALLTASTVRHATNLELCNAYQLAAWQHQWQFDPDPSLAYCGG